MSGGVVVAFFTSWHLVTNCPKANQGKKSHNDVEAVLMNHINNHTHMTATKAKFFPGDKLQADIFITGVTTIDNPAARNWYLDVTSTNPMGATNQEFINRAALGRQPGPEEHDSRNEARGSASTQNDGNFFYFLFKSKRQQVDNARARGGGGPVRQLARASPHKKIDPARGRTK